MVTEKQLMSAYNKVFEYENKLSNALGELGKLVSSIYDEEITADLCNGSEIEFHRPSFGYDDNEIAIRIEDVMQKLKFKIMTQEEKQLLLKDLCTRLPYLVKGLYQWKGNVPFDRELDGRLYDELYLSLYSTEDSSFKPYLRPMSSMTEEEVFEFIQISDSVLRIGEKKSTCILSLEQMDWLNANHFDYRGLIPMGLALEATKGIYKNEY